jgi:hypothetical protein
MKTIREKIYDSIRSQCVNDCSAKYVAAKAVEQVCSMCRHWIREKTQHEVECFSCKRYHPDLFEPKGKNEKSMLQL